MVAKQEIYEKHPELFHYTGIGGVAGILKSQNLWATHYKFLNDTSELQLMRAELGKRFFPIVKERLDEIDSQSDIKKRTEIKKAGGTIAIARDEAKHLADTFYRISFEDTASRPALAIPYITSFCAHTSDQPYEQENGLLSQWRGYAKGGYAIVFDTRKLCDLFRAEWDHHYYGAPGFLGDVVYQGDEQAFEEEFQESLEKIKSRFRIFFETRNLEVGEIIGDVLSMFTRLKHCGFHEEREVRSIVFPMSKEIEDAAYRSVDPTYVSPNKPMKKIKKRPDGAPYIELFDFDNEVSLPIRRIIVGPQNQQDAAKTTIEHLIGNRRIDVHCSKTPLVF